jgi:hypothetical protein
MQIDCKQQLAKHKFSIRVNAEPVSNTNLSTLASEKDDLPRTSTDRGTKIEPNEQRAKQKCGIRVNAEPLSKITTLTSASEKQASPRTSTERGMQIVPKEQAIKQESSIRLSSDSPSVVNAAIVAFEKHKAPNTSTELGSQIDLTRQKEKHDSSIRLNLAPLSNAYTSIAADAKHNVPKVSADRGTQIRPADWTDSILRSGVTSPFHNLRPRRKTSSLTCVGRPLPLPGREPPRNLVVAKAAPHFRDCLVPSRTRRSCSESGRPEPVIESCDDSTAPLRCVDRSRGHKTAIKSVGRS